MKAIFLEEAKQEFFEAIIYYENAHPTLGAKFKSEVEKSILWILDHPET